MADCRADALLLRALRCEPQERIPVWVMRQAGRYLPEYRKLRAQAGSFLKLCMTPELACEATLQPIRRFALDAAIVFSDILVVPDAMGCELGFAEGEGPFLSRRANSKAAIAALRKVEPGDLPWQEAAVAACRSELPADIPLIGFAGAPYTLACYMIEGRGGSDFAAARRMLYADPELFMDLLNRIADAAAACLIGQARAGADVLMLFDSWAALAPPEQFERCLVEPVGRIIRILRDAGIKAPVIAFPRNAVGVSASLVAAGSSAIAVGWQQELADARAAVGVQAAVQGNLDPAALLAGEASLREQVRRVVSAHAAAPGGSILNLGHGIRKETDPNAVAILVDEARSASEGLLRQG